MGSHPDHFHGPGGTGVHKIHHRRRGPSERCKSDQAAVKPPDGSRIVAAAVILVLTNSQQDIYIIHSTLDEK